MDSRRGAEETQLSARTRSRRHPVPTFEFNSYFVSSVKLKSTRIDLITTWSRRYERAQRTFVPNVANARNVRHLESRHVMGSLRTKNARNANAIRDVLRDRTCVRTRRHRDARVTGIEQRKSECCVFYDRRYVFLRLVNAAPHLTEFTRRTLPGSSAESSLTLRNALLIYEG